MILFIGQNIANLYWYLLVFTEGMFVNQSFECLCMFCGLCLSHCFLPYLSLVLIRDIAIILDLLHFILKHMTLVAAVTQHHDNLDGLHKAVLEPFDVLSAYPWELHVLIHPETFRPLQP